MAELVLDEVLLFHFLFSYHLINSSFSDGLGLSLLPNIEIERLRNGDFVETTLLFGLFLPMVNVVLGCQLHIPKVPFFKSSLCRFAPLGDFLVSIIELVVPLSSPNLWVTPVATFPI